MRWGVKEVNHQRVAFVAQVKAGGSTMSELCRQFQISRPTGYKWLRRYEAVGSFSALKEESRRPHCSPRRIDERIEKRIIQLRQETGWGAKKLRKILQRDEGIEIGRMTVNRILDRNGLLREEDRHPQATQRFEMERPNELWQMDFKGQFLMKKGSCYPLSVLDDHSRYVLGLVALSRPNHDNVEPALIGIFQQYGLPDAMLMDHGSPWWTTASGHGLTRLSVMLIEQGIHLKYSRIRHPQTQGKVEKWHDTLRRAVRHQGEPHNMHGWSELFERIRQQYNHVRPHEGIQDQVPADRYRVSAKVYREHPREWEYPAGSIVKRIGRQGELHWHGHIYFISEALHKRRVRVEPIGSKLLVSYRHMYIREIEIGGSSRPIVKSITDPVVQTATAVEKQKPVFPQPFESSIHSLHNLDD